MFSDWRNCISTLRLITRKHTICPEKNALTHFSQNRNLAVYTIFSQIAFLPCYNCSSKFAACQDHKI